MRARSLKPGFFENEKLGELSFECRLCFAGLWCYSDRAGRFEWRTKRIKALLFPYDKIDIDRVLKSLQDKNFIICYEVSGQNYGWIPTFLKHQNPHPHEAKSTLPEPPEEKVEENPCHDMSLHVTECNSNVMLTPSSLTPSSLTPDTNTLVQSHNGNGSELEEIVATIALIKNESFQVTQKDINEWQETFPAVDVAACIKLIKKWNQDNPQKRKTVRGIRKHITGWLTREQDKGGGTFKAGSTKPGYWDEP